MYTENAIKIRETVAAYDYFEQMFLEFVYD